MKKKEIMEILEHNFEIEKKQKALSIGAKNGNFSTTWLDLLFPDIEELKESFHLIKDEIITSYKYIEELSKTQKSNCECEHQVRLKYYSWVTSISVCVFCGKKINGDNLTSGDTIYNSTNRNRGCVMLLGEEDYEEALPQYSKKDVLNLILSILEGKNDEEEIDFIQEFKKLNLKNCTIDEREKIKEYYVLVIGGSNKEKIDKGCLCISSKSSDISINISDYLVRIPNVHVELFDSCINLDSSKFEKTFSKTNKTNFRKASYESIEELKCLIEKEKHVPFDMIIDTSNLFTYKIVKNKIIPHQYLLDFKEYFPNSYIINMPLFQDITKDKKKILLESEKRKIDKVYGIYLNEQEQYYSYENDDLKKIEVDDINEEIRKILIKR